MKCERAQTILKGLNSKVVLADLTDQEIGELKTGNFAYFLNDDDYKSLSNDVSRIDSITKSEVSEGAEISKEMSIERMDEEKAHSITFHFKGEQKKKEILDEVKEEQEKLDKLKTEYLKEKGDLANLIAKKTMLDVLFKNGSSYIGITSSGRALLSNLTLKMYRVSDIELDEYLKQEQAIDDEITSIAKNSVDHFNRLITNLNDVDETHLWSVCVGLSKIDGDAKAMDDKFVSAYRYLKDQSKNTDNVMMAAEMLAETPIELNEAFNELTALEKTVHHHLHISKESSVGVASMLYLGRNLDGTYPTENLRRFMFLTPSTDAASVMAIVHIPEDEISSKFNAMKDIFRSWCYDQSEDTELASAYLAISEIPAQGFQTKLGIIIEGVKNYLEYPLVASAIIAQISVFEANDALNILSRAYTILGRYIRDLDQPELIGLAVRAIHGMKNETIRNLDTSATIKDTPVQFTYRPYGFFMPYYVGFSCVHSGYFSTYSAIGGAHPGHIHVSGGMQG